MNSNEETGHFCPGRKMWKVPFIIAAIVLIKSVVVFLIWNAMVPDLFHLPPLTYLQAIGLTVLVRILVGFGHGPRHHFQHHRWRAHWAGLSKEEREKLREEIAKRCGD
jgi:hypothetical protein